MKILSLYSYAGCIKTRLKLEDSKRKSGSCYIREQDPLKIKIEMPKLQRSNSCTHTLDRLSLLHTSITFYQLARFNKTVIKVNNFISYWEKL